MRILVRLGDVGKSRKTVFGPAFLSVEGSYVTKLVRVNDIYLCASYTKLLDARIQPETYV